MYQILNKGLTRSGPDGILVIQDGGRVNDAVHTNHPNVRLYRENVALGSRSGGGARASINIAIADGERRRDLDGPPQVKPYGYQQRWRLPGNNLTLTPETFRIQANVRDDLFHLRRNHDALGEVTDVKLIISRPFKVDNNGWSGHSYNFEVTGTSSLQVGLPVCSLMSSFVFGENRTTAKPSTNHARDRENLHHARRRGARSGEYTLALHGDQLLI